MTPQPLVIDASVLLAASSPAEQRHGEAVAFFAALKPAVRLRMVLPHQPRLWLLEVFANAQRNRAARDFNILEAVMSEHDPLHFAHVELTDEDVGRVIGWHQTSVPGSKPHVRGGDLVYVAIAMRLGCPLVSLDAGMLKYPGAETPATYAAQHLQASRDAAG